jgi:hypothetical protein
MPVALADFWAVFPRRRYTPDLARSDFHFFAHFKQFRGNTLMGIDEEVRET